MLFLIRVHRGCRPFMMCVFVCVSSYLHCEWATEQQLEKDKRIQQKIKRFKMKQAQRALLFADVGWVSVCAHTHTHTRCEPCSCEHTPGGVVYEQMCFVTICCLFRRSACLNMQIHRYRVCGCVIYLFSCLCLSGPTHLCAYIQIFVLTQSLQQWCSSQIPDGEWALWFILSSLLSLSLSSSPFRLSQMEEEPFNPDYVEVDRVLEVSYCEDKDTGEVKWIPFHSLIISLSSSRRAFYLCLRAWTCFALLFFSFFVAPFEYILHH